MFVFSSIRSRIRPSSSAAALAQTDEQVADRRGASRRADDRQLWRAYVILAVLCVSGFSFFLWYMVTTNRELARLHTEAASSERKLKLLERETQESKTQLAKIPQNFGLFSTEKVTQLSRSIVEVHARWISQDYNARSAAFHLGEGYFLTVKHGYTKVFDKEAKEEVVATVLHLDFDDLTYDLTIVDQGKTTDIESGDDMGDWAIVKTAKPLNIPVMQVDTATGLPYGSPIVRFGNDFGEGIQYSFGHMGPKRPSGLYNSLMPVHGGMSGGAVVNLEGNAIGMCTGKDRRGDYFAYIRPITPDMLKSVPHLRGK